MAVDGPGSQTPATILLDAHLNRVGPRDIVTPQLIVKWELLSPAATSQRLKRIPA
jgi:hypothetical protein